MPKTANPSERETISNRDKTAPTLLAAGNELLAANPHFQFSEALEAALFAKAAYSHSSATGTFLSSIGWKPLASATSSLEVSNAYAFAGRREDADGVVHFVLAFEGSNSPFDLVQYKDWTEANLSKYGWSNYYAKVQSLMASVLDEALKAKSAGKPIDIVITGHSLGGAAASVAYADLFLPPQGGFWPASGAPLQSNSRIYAHPNLRQWSQDEIRGLLDNTEAYVFGAPSFLIDPNKFDALGWLKFGLTLLSPSSVIDFFFNLGKNVADVVIVNDTRVPNLAGFQNSVFQFEHRNSDSLLGLNMDPVAALGSRQAGTEIAINLDDATYKRYGGNPLALHSMDYYAESIERAISGAPLVRNSTSYVESGVLLPRYNKGTPANDMLVNLPLAAGLAGNDVFIANAAGSYRWDGGQGDDVYVISGFGISATVSGPALEGTDNLYFAVDGNLSSASSTRDGKDWIFTVTGADPSQVSTVRVVGDKGYEIDFVGLIQMSNSSPWTVSAFPLG